MVTFAQNKAIQPKGIGINSDTSFVNRMHLDSVFYDSLYHKLKRRVFTKALYDLLFKSQNNSTKNNIEENTDLDSFSGKVINQILIKKLPPFGASVKDTVINQNLIKIAKIGNSTHVLTRNSVIRKNLFFEVGDRVNPIEIQNNARLLRQLRFFVDAKILVKDDPKDSNGVIILVITQDIFSLELTGSFSNLGKWSIGFAEKNMFGLAHSFSNKLLYNNRHKSKYGYQGTYRINNISGSFINSLVEYTNKYDEEKIVLGFDRPFISPELEYIGSAQIGYHYLNQNIFSFNPLFDSLRFSYYQQKIWAGRAFKLKPNIRQNNIQLITSLGIKNRSYKSRPEATSKDTLHYFHNYTRVLSRVYFVKQNYSKNTLIYGFGRTEDIPYGYGFGLTVGKENGEFYNRIYTAFDIKTAFYSNSAGFLGFYFGVGGFWDKNIFEQGILKTSMNLFTKFTRISRKLGLRNFLDLNYTLGINRFPNEKISSPDFIEAPISSNVYGTKRLDMSWETVLFTNRSYLSFNFAFFGFINAGMIGDHHDTFKKSNHFLGYGIGIRFANERLLFSTFQFSFGYYPVLPKNFSSRNFVYGLQNSSRVNTSDYFRNEAPEIIKFE